MQKHESYGFVRVGTAVPRLKVADCDYNASQIVELLKQAQAAGVSLVVFPELSLTGYTCADLFLQAELRRSALEALSALASSAASVYAGLAFVGVPVWLDDQLFNCAVALQAGEVLGVVPKTFIPNYKEFYERRWFAPSDCTQAQEIILNGKTVPFGVDLLFCANDEERLVVGAEICEDLWVPVPPSSYQALAGATLLVNLSASNELIGKAAYRRQLVSNQSGRCLAAYAYSSSGGGESSTDLVFSGHCLLAENGAILLENQRFEKENFLQFVDFDFERLAFDRLRANSFGDNKRSQAAEHKFRKVPFNLPAAPAPEKLARQVDAHPFVPRGKEHLAERCQEIFNIQVAALSKRLEALGDDPRKLKITIGVSGGLDSTLSLLVLAKTMDRLALPRNCIQAFNLPGFGTTNRTRENALCLIKMLGAQTREIDICKLCFEEMLALEHKPFGIELKELTLDELLLQLENLPEGSQDLVFENVQARMRTSILMNSGFVVGTGDVSELALGWCTYNGDHMSMYNPNASIPKTLVKFLVDWAAHHEFTGEIQKILKDVVNTEISPELLPAGKDGKIAQKTESSVGPYELADFFLFHMLRFGFSPEKISYLAGQAAFDKPYTEAEIRKWLHLFVRRFFSSQFKRSCLPDGPKVGSVSLSPRGDWRMPSDARSESWLKGLEQGSPAEPVLRTAPAASPKKRKTKRALGLVDPLNGFGSATHTDGRGHHAELPVPGGEKVGPLIGMLQAKRLYDFCFAGVDEHPPDMFNFASQCPGKTPLADKIFDRDGKPALIYPDHCQKGSWSARFLPGVREDLIDEIFPKGYEQDRDSHSVCGNPGLIPRLKELGITHVDLVGLVFRICVGFSAIDLVRAGFKVRVLTDCTRDLDLAEYEGVITEMKKLGVEMLTSDKVTAAEKN
jgi:NAD+ synthase (glutamine-hydrolysing)